MQPIKLFRRFRLALALSSASCSLINCASAPRNFTPMDQCWFDLEADTFACVDTTGKAYNILIMNSKDLVCYHSAQMKVFNEQAHK